MPGETEESTIKWVHKKQYSTSWSGNIKCTLIETNGGKFIQLITELFLLLMHKYFNVEIFYIIKNLVKYSLLKFNFNQILQIIIGPAVFGGPPVNF